MREFFFQSIQQMSGNHRQGRKSIVCLSGIVQQLYQPIQVSGPQNQLNFNINFLRIAYDHISAELKFMAQVLKQAKFFEKC